LWAAELKKESKCQRRNQLDPQKHTLTLEELSADEIRSSRTPRLVKEVSTRRNREGPRPARWLVVNAFFEDSTRTETSFSLAAQRLSADLIDVTEKGSSVSKGETADRQRSNSEEMGIDVIVLRHKAAGAGASSCEKVQCSVVNAGDGAHEITIRPARCLYDETASSASKGGGGHRRRQVNSGSHGSNRWALTKWALK